MMSIFCFPLLLCHLLILGAGSMRNTLDVLSLERELVQNFRDYAKELEKKIEMISYALSEYNSEIEEANEDPELYLSNPLNAFRLIRHMHQDWIYWEAYMGEQIGSAQLEALERLLPRLPHRSVFKQAVKRFQEISQFYGFTPTSLLSKEVPASSPHLTALDCYYIGEELYKENKYHEALDWLTVAARNYTTSPYTKIFELLGISHWQVHELLSKTLMNLNRRDDAYIELKKAIELDPTNVQLLIREGELELLSLRDPEPSIPASDRPVSDLELRCRGNIKQDSELNCEYNKVVTPFLELAPLKLEIMLFDPYVMLYHDGIHQQEIAHVQDAFERCPDSSKFGADNGVKGCSISERYSPITKRIESRLLDMTGLNEPIKNLYVLQYGLTKSFKIFELFKNLSMVANLNFDDIEATVILFLKDVPLGGAITIPNYDIAVYPRQGDAMVSFNEGDFEHTVCPNVVGSSLVLVKFFYFDT